MRSAFQLGIVVARRPVAGRWAGYETSIAAVLPAPPAVAPGTCLGVTRDSELIYAGSAELALHAAATGSYRDNLAAARPSLWVALHMGSDGACEITRVTADPYEGEALTEAIDVVVETADMPGHIRTAIEAFIAAFHVERPVIKRRRRKHASPGEMRRDAFP